MNGTVAAWPETRLQCLGPTDMSQERPRGLFTHPETLSIDRPTSARTKLETDQTHPEGSPSEAATGHRKGSHHPPCTVRTSHSPSRRGPTTKLGGVIQQQPKEASKGRIRLSAILLSGRECSSGSSAAQNLCVLFSWRGRSAGARGENRAPVHSFLAKITLCKLGKRFLGSFPGGNTGPPLPTAWAASHPPGILRLASPSPYDAEAIGSGVGRARSESSASTLLCCDQVR